MFQIYQVKSSDDLRRIHSNQEYNSWGWFEIDDEYFILTIPTALEKDDGFSKRIRGLAQALGIYRPEPGDSDRGIYWDLLYDEFPEHSAT